MTIELNREAIARIAALPGVAEAAEAGSALISLWPLPEAMGHARVRTHSHRSGCYDA